MTHNANQTSSGGLLAPKNSALGGSMGDVSSMRSEAKKQSAAGFTSFNRFSTFVKSGGESFVLGKLNANVQESDVIQVVVRIIWISDESYIEYVGFTEKLKKTWY